MQPGQKWLEGWEGVVGGWEGGILQSDISYAINPIWIDILPSHTVKKTKLSCFFLQCFQM